MPRSPVGFKIRERRKARGLTQAALAELAGVSGSYLNLIESGKRSAGGALLGRIARRLEIDVKDLTGAEEHRMLADLGELAHHATLRGLPLDPDSVHELVGRHPDWARALLTLYRAYLESTETVNALADRLNRDPFLGGAVHRMLTHITSIRSASGILDDVADLPEPQRERFQRVIAKESERLSDVAQSLVEFFDSAHTHTRALTVTEEVDDFIIANDNYFPTLEAAGAEFGKRLTRRGGVSLVSLTELLERDHGIAVSLVPPAESAPGRFQNQCEYLPDRRTLAFHDNAPISTRRFQVARLLAELGSHEAIDEIVLGARFGSDEARLRARRALASYVASACLMPYQRFLDEAREARFDVELLRQRFECSFEQVCHRLVTLRRASAPGIPFAFLRATPSGQVSKRFPIPGLPMVSYGHGCPLWAVFECFQTPGRLHRQLVVFPDGARFLFVARTVTKQPGSFHEPPFLHAVMLACDVLHASETVYADGLELDRVEHTIAVGPTCRLCSREDCRQRQEASVVRTAHAAAPPVPFP